MCIKRFSADKPTKKKDLVKDKKKKEENEGKEMEKEKQVKKNKKMKVEIEPVSTGAIGSMVLIARQGGEILEKKSKNMGF